MILDLNVNAYLKPYHMQKNLQNDTKFKHNFQKMKTARQLHLEMCTKN